MYAYSICIGCPILNASSKNLEKYGKYEKCFRQKLHGLKPHDENTP